MAETAITNNIATLKREYDMSLVEVSVSKLNEKIVEVKLDQSSW